MSSPYCGLAITEALSCGNAILKFISPNDVGLTGSHQCGYYLPKSAWDLFAGFGPEKGRNDESPVTVVWQGGLVTTNSRVKWYGKAKNEYRLTRFGKGFPFLAEECVGDLLVIVPQSLEEFSAFVLELDDDIEEVQSALGVAILDTWAVFRHGAADVESPDECVDRNFRHFAAKLRAFPSGEAFSEAARKALLDCIEAIRSAGPDRRLVDFVAAEYKLFRLVERQLCDKEVTRAFKDINDFLDTASRIMNRRKSRAGRSLENHVDYVLSEAKIPHTMRPRVDGRPDVVIPGEKEYLQSDYPVNRLVVVGVKTTCKDRWRQVVREGRRVPTKHIITMQQGISSAQLEEMREAKVELVVPRPFHGKYPPETRRQLLTLESFIEKIRPLCT